MPRAKKEPAANGAAKRPRKKKAPESYLDANGRLPPDQNPAYQPPPLPWHTGETMPLATVRWLWEGWLSAGAPALLYGPSQRGKSTVARAIAAAVAGGPPLPGMERQPPRPVIWFASEEDYRRVVTPYLLAAGALKRYLHFPEDQIDGTRRRLLILDHARQVHQVVEKTGAALVVWDKVRSFVGGACGPDSNDAGAAVMQALTDLGTQTGATSLVIKHPRKGGRGAADEQISGGMEWFNGARHILLNTPHPDRQGATALVCQKNSLGEAPQSLLWKRLVRGGAAVCDWQGACDLTADQADRGADSIGERGALIDAKAFLADRLSDGEQPVKDLERWAEEAGISRGTLRRAKEEMGVISSPFGPIDSRYWVWQLKGRS